MWIFGSFAIGLTLLSVLLFIPGYSEAAYVKYKKHNRLLRADAFKFFLPQKSHIAGPVIIYINLILFFIMLFSGVDMINPRSSELLRWGALNRVLVLNGEWWRLVTCMFLHAGPVHLILNLTALIIASVFIERMLGWKKVFTLYFISGICGSLVNIWWHADGVGVGSSAAIFGLFGGMIGILLTSKSANQSHGGLLIFISIYVIFNLIIGITGGVDNAAHIGGLASGVLMGVMLYKPCPAAPK